jgi:hypothetical protein
LTGVDIQTVEKLKLTSENNLNHSKFEILKFYDLLEYDSNMARLYHDLKKWLAEYFNDQPYIFSPNQRIVFWHTDLDYYIHAEFPGFTLYNLQLILKELDISNYFCAVVSAMPDYHIYTELARKLLTTDQFAISGITSTHSGPTPDWVSNSLPATWHSNVQYPFIVLSRRNRFHRTYFMSQLFEHQLQNQGLVAYNNLIDSSDNTPSIDETCPCQFLYTIPYTRHNSNLVLQKEKNRNIVRKFTSQVCTFKNFSELTDLSRHANAMSSLSNIQQCLIYVGLETTVSNPKPFTSLISFKGMAEQRPFILFAPSGQLSFIKEMGFKTFGDFWDEGYDNIIDVEDRVDAIMTILKHVSSLDQDKLTAMLKAMEPIIEHNYYHYANNFHLQEVNKVYQGLSR